MLTKNGNAIYKGESIYKRGVTIKPYADLSDYEIYYYLERSANSPDNNLTFHVPNANNVFTSNEEMEIIFFVPDNYDYTKSLYVFNSSFPGIGLVNPQVKLDFSKYGSNARLRASQSCSQKDNGGYPKMSIVKDYAPNDVKGFWKVKWTKDKLYINEIGTSWPAQNTRVSSKPNSMQFPTQLKLEGFRFYSLTIPNKLKVLPAKKISTNKLCLLDLYSGSFTYPNTGSESMINMGPINPDP